MAKFIKSIVDRIQLANRKGLCPYYSPLQIGAEVHAESLNVWKKLVKEFEATQIISVYLEPLKAKETVALTTGAGTLVDSKGKYKTGILTTADKKVTIINIDKWHSAINDTVRVPDVENPIARIDNADIIVRPTSLASVIVHYLKRPTLPVWAYTESGDDYVYNDAASIDFEWPEELHDEIVNRVLTNLGISQRERDMIQYGNIEQQKEGR